MGLPVMPYLAFGNQLPHHAGDLFGVVEPSPNPSQDFCAAPEPAPREWNSESTGGQSRLSSPSVITNRSRPSVISNRSLPSQQSHSSGSTRASVSFIDTVSVGYQMKAVRSQWKVEDGMENCNLRFHETFSIDASLGKLGEGTFGKVFKCKR